ncbi:hypothetical protein [Streptomyces sp. AM6-12]|uniref:hypothetical protein n=1 Tax=Streptomyces sp. AM6-12 TaxID=3345149 RepID=UPI0037B98DC9
MISTLERVLTLLTLDIPAVRDLATALLVKQEPSEELCLECAGCAACGQCTGPHVWPPLSN